MRAMKDDPDALKPYLVRAVYEWCLDNGDTPHVMVRASKSTVPAGIGDEAGIAVLNIGPAAVRNLKIDNDRIAFTARFKGSVFDVLLHYEDVLVVFGKETGQKVSFLRLAAESGPQADRPKPRGAPDLKAY